MTASILFSCLAQQLFIRSSCSSFECLRQLSIACLLAWDGHLWRLDFCSTTFQARQLISHKKIYVNYKMVNIPGFQVSNGDLISIQGNSLYCIKSKIRQNLLDLLLRFDMFPPSSWSC